MNSFKTKNQKLTSLQTIRLAIARHKRSGKKIVFTNGCFDILHAGHVRYLRQAKSLGDILVVGLNTDRSIKKLKKAPNRPIHSEKDRAEVLGGLESVDHIVLFSDETPERLIRAIRPDFLVKGGDWKKGAMAGGVFVGSYGGKVLSLGYSKGLSTTATLKKIGS